MKTLEEIRSGLWLGTPGNKIRLNEREWEQLVAAIEAGGWVLMPREPTDAMIEAAYEVRGTGSAVTPFYAAMIEARPR